MDPCCWLVATLASYHFQTRNLNEFNPGLGVEVPYAAVRFVGGEYRNSFERTSWYAGATWTPWRIGPARVGIIGGAITGYTRHPVLPMVLPTLQIEGSAVGANLYYAPRIKDGSSVVGLQVKFRW
jgi:hypothetical protein